MTMVQFCTSKVNIGPGITPAFSLLSHFPSLILHPDVGEGVKVGLEVGVNEGVTVAVFVGIGDGVAVAVWVKVGGGLVGVSVGIEVGETEVVKDF
jgi:hypothetical protein